MRGEVSLSANLPADGGTRRCNKCEQLKPLHSFYANRRSLYGRHSTCKACSDERRRLSRDNTRGRYLARAKVANAIAAGRISRQPCEVCAEQKAEAHHDDYNKPLNVRWLCRGCHLAWHRSNTPIYPEEEIGAQP